MRKIIYTKALVDLIAGCIFDGLTDEETGLLAGVHGSTIGRLRAGTECKEIRVSVVERMRKYIALIRDGEDRSNRWQRIAWFLERRYPDRWAKPEVLLNINSSGANVTNNTLVITAEQAQGLKIRNANLDEQLQKLVLPGSSGKQSLVACSSLEESEGLGQSHNNSHEISQDPVSDLTPSITKSSSVVLAGEGAAPTRTPDAAVARVEPILPPKSRSPALSRNYRPGIDPRPPGKSGPPKKEKSGKNVENFNILDDSSNNKIREETVLKKKPGRPKKKA